MTAPSPENELYQIQLFLEELCCDLCRLGHVSREGLPPESIRIDREFYLGVPGAYADIRVAVPGQQPYFVEIKYGYPDDKLLKHLRRKYGAATAPVHEAAKLVLAIDCANRSDWQRIEAELRRCLPSALKLEVWDEHQLLGQARECFGVEIESLSVDHLLDLRHAVDKGKGFHAFGGDNFADYYNDALKSQLLWHFGFWRLRQLRELQKLTPREVLRPDLYQEVVILLADLCSFSSYVRDTRDDQVLRDALTAFYSKSRYEIINNGGMLYQFVGDEVIGLFGVPDRQPGFVQNALETARGLVHIGNAVSNHWQRHIDRVQASAGVHIGMAIGNLQILSLRPFSRAYMGAIGDSINMAARLMATAGPSEIVVSNSFYYVLAEEAQADFQEVEPVEARNIGRIKAWKLNLFPQGERQPSV